MQIESGSFRDRNNQVFYHQGEVYRGISKQAYDNWLAISDKDFFQELISSKKIVGTSIAQQGVYPDSGWAAILHHDRIPYVSYPYEWAFGMLKEAALLHLAILEQGIQNGWILKDASAYNVQWNGHKPVFIDTTSFEPHVSGTPWLGYRQFCMMFLNPLLLKAHKNIDYLPLLRSNLEGIEPTETAKFFNRSEIWRKGVSFHVFMHAMIQLRTTANEIQGKRGNQSGYRPKHTKSMVLGTLQSIRRIIKSLKVNQQTTTWSHYDETHSYLEDTFVDKKEFVEKHVSKKQWLMVWDIGCNTGTFSKICSPYAEYVVSMDGDAMAIETLFDRFQHEKFTNILPLVMDLANLSPAQGWMGKERKTIEERGKPDLLLCLALIHHMVISANIPLRSYIEWIRSLDCVVIIEFVGPSDEMTMQLLKNKANQYEDYNEENFLSILKEMFTVRDSRLLKDGKRTIYYLEPFD